MLSLVLCLCYVGVIWCYYVVLPSRYPHDKLWIPILVQVLSAPLNKILLIHNAGLYSTVSAWWLSLWPVVSHSWAGQHPEKRRRCACSPLAIGVSWYVFLKGNNITSGSHVQGKCTGIIISAKLLFLLKSVWLKCSAKGQNNTWLLWMEVKTFLSRNVWDGAPHS